MVSKFAFIIKLTCNISLSFNKFFYYLLTFFFIFVKMFKDSSARYYQDNKERHKKNLVKDIKRKKRQNGSEWYKNLPEDENQKLVEYRMKYYKIRKNTLS